MIIFDFISSRMCFNTFLSFLHICKFLCTGKGSVNWNSFQRSEPLTGVQWHAKPDFNLHKNSFNFSTVKDQISGFTVIISIYTVEISVYTVLFQFTRWSFQFTQSYFNFNLHGRDFSLHSLIWISIYIGNSPDWFT